MLICYDCVNELKNEYLEKIKKEKGLKYTIERQRSKIKRQLLDDEDSRLSIKSYYTDNNSYIPKNDYRKMVKYEDNPLLHSYNEIFTDYSKRRKKNKIRNQKKENKNNFNNYINRQEEMNHNLDNKNKRKIQDRYEDKELINDNEIFSGKDKDNIHPKRENIFNNNEEKKDENENNNWNINSNPFQDINRNIKLTSKEDHKINNNKYSNYDKKDINYNAEDKNNNLYLKGNDENNFDNYDKKKINYSEFKSEKDFNERNSKDEDIYDSIFYERCENPMVNGESNYIKKNKNKKKSKNDNKVIKKAETKEANINQNKETTLSNQEEKSNELSKETEENLRNVVFNNRYINNYYRNDVTEKFNFDNNQIKNRQILYQDFYYKDVSFSANSSSRSSLNSLSESNNELRTNYPRDGHRQRIKRNKVKEPENEFDKYIFEQINSIRSNPKSFINKIEAAKKNIGVDKKNNYIYNGKQKILLNNGIYAFDNAIKHLDVLRDMEKLKYNPKLNIKLPSTEEEINDRKYQKEMVNDLLKNKIKIKSFWREIIKDPEECLTLMIVDDCGNNCGFKRKDLLDPRITSIGINSIKIGKYFACYIQLN